MSDYQTIIGLEIHIELNTKSKMFSAAPNNPFYGRPNEQVAPVDLGLPGTLPVPNRSAINKTILFGLVLNGQIARQSKFDRKHYFYPDLPKGYQISQYDQPLVVGGSLTVAGVPVRLTRIHLEEDAGKLLHSAGGSRVDLNRAGVPLMEIVTEPDIVSTDQLDAPALARLFLKELRQLARDYDVSTADMEKGMLRCDANINISFSHEGQRVKTYISEIKNLNSFRSVERACRYEAERLYREWHDSPDKRQQQNKITVGWDEAAGQTVLQRSKEDAADYRYFPEPDIPPLYIYDSDDQDNQPPTNTEAVFDLAVLRTRLQHGDRIALNTLQQKGIIDEAASASIRKKGWPKKILTDLFERSFDRTKTEWSLLLALLLHDAAAGNTAAQLEEVAGLRSSNEISSNTASALLVELAKNPAKTALALIDERGWRQESRDEALRPVIMEVLAENAAVVADLKAGKEAAIGRLIGQVMQRSGGAADPKKVRELILAAIND